MKFVKCLGSALEGVKKMLNLITAQVSTRQIVNETNHPIHNPQHIPNLQCLAKEAIRGHFEDIRPIPHEMLSLDILCHREDDNHMLNFCKTSYICTIDRSSTSPIHYSNTFFLSLSKYLPHWTSSSADKFTFATIKEGQTATPTDVKTYVNHLKTDLKIGSEGFPNKIILVGDEQIYSILMNIKEQNNDDYEWLCPVPGDWHMLKLTAEVLRGVMWDGGLKDFAVKCGHKANNVVTQWQDINLLLLATYEALMRKATSEYMKTTSEDSVRNRILGMGKESDEN